MTEYNVGTDYDSAIVDAIAANNYRLELPPLTIFLARSFGFCYGVRRAIELAYAARRDYPDARLRLTAEIIHNPQVNGRLREMGIEIPDKKCAAPAPVTPDEIVIIPAFGLPTAREQQLRATGATVIDTTCSSVKQVWRRVETLARDGFTAVIHGNPKHEETVATAGRAVVAGGNWIVVRDLQRAEMLARVIAGEIPLQPDTLGEGTLSPQFDPARHLQQLGMANQTTMLRLESLAIAQTVAAAVRQRDGNDEHFRNFDTICNATQKRQDAVRDLAQLTPDTVLVIGGFNSSNTTHLAQLAAQFAPTWHIEDADDLRSATELRHLPHDSREPAIHSDPQQPWLKPRIALTAGASTPNRTVGLVIQKLAALAGAKLPPTLS